MEARANTILHELAHMWFGDLVTMKWWNDLWLNESFAEFMSHLALAEATKYTEGWTGFMVRKDWGLKQDQLPTTHPITAEIRDLADVEVNFDGITYAKGASVLRQLVSYVGRDAFFAGLHEYLTKHSYANATLDDLLSELAAASGRDLASWSKVWLEEAGVTLLRPVITTSEDGTIERLEITQEAFSEGASLRPHRMGVAGYSLTEEGTLAQVFREELDIDGTSTVIEAAAGIARPDFILVNDGDLGYAKVRLDEQSLAFAITNITKFTDSLTRGVVMASAWDMTRDGEMPARDYLNLALRAVPVEDNMSLLTLTLRHIDEAVRTFVAPKYRAEAAAAESGEPAPDARPQELTYESSSGRSAGAALMQVGVSDVNDDSKARLQIQPALEDNDEWAVDLVQRAAELIAGAQVQTRHREGTHGHGCRLPELCPICTRGRQVTQP